MFFLRHCENYLPLFASLHPNEKVWLVILTQTTLFLAQLFHRGYLAASSICIFSRMVLSSALMIEFLTYVRRTAMAIRREVALLARVFT